MRPVFRSKRCLLDPAFADLRGGRKSGFRINMRSINVFLRARAHAADRTAMQTKPGYQQIGIVVRDSSGRDRYDLGKDDFTMAAQDGTPVDVQFAKWEPSIPASVSARFRFRIAILFVDGEGHRSLAKAISSESISGPSGNQSLSISSSHPPRLHPHSGNLEQASTRGTFPLAHSNSDHRRRLGYHLWKRLEIDSSGAMHDSG